MGENPDEYGHLSKFLQDQISTRSSKRSTLSNTSRRAKNNAIIEKANKLKHDRSAVQQLAAEHGAANCQKVPLAQFN
jgi:hypothetical protein